jgi:hypothetical protein
MIDQMHIYLVQESAGHGEAVVIAASKAQAKEVAETDAQLRVNERTVVSRIGTPGPDDPHHVLPILILAHHDPDLY